MPTPKDTRRRAAQARVLLADDHQLFPEALAGAVTIAEEVVRAAAAHHPLSERRAA